MQNLTIAILGAGNMGSSLLGGLLATGCSRDQLWITDPDTEKLAQLEDQFKVQVSTENKVAAAEAKVIILAVKPMHMKALINELSTLPNLADRLLISIAAGITIHNIEQWLQQPTAIIRCMPNTPALLRCGASALFANNKVSAEQRNLATNILAAIGKVVWLEAEAQMDAVTALSGSGPAYFFLLMEAMEACGVHMGLSQAISQELTYQTALGAARMAQESQTSVSDLRAQVTSKGGTTAAALQVFEQKQFKSMVMQALEAARKRSEELAKEYS